MRRKNEKDWALIKEFPIGTKVMVTATMGHTNPFDGIIVRRCWTSYKCGAFVAWVSGAKWVCEGEYTNAITADEFGNAVFATERQLKVTNKIPVLLVRKSMFGKETIVPARGIKAILTDSKSPVTTKRTWWTDEDRAEARDWANSFERDVRGRFIRYAPELQVAPNKS